MAKTVDAYIADHDYWSAELEKLRAVLAATGMNEEIKWGMPVYTAHGQNIVGIAGFKNHFGLWFYQGALLKDLKNLLINAQEGKTKAMRQWRMTGATDIKPPIIKAYVNEAIANAEKGAAIKPDRDRRLVVPKELKDAFTRNKKAGAAFKAMTPGKKREYADYIMDAKRDDTKQRRIEKILPMIEAGAGLNDKYKNC